MTDNILQMRKYAKSIGVRNPTVLNKAQLDEAVRRRELELGITREKHNVYDYSAEERKSLAVMTSSRNRVHTFVGYFCPFAEGDGVLRRDPFSTIPENDAYVCADFVRDCGLIAGDCIVGNICFVSYNNIRVLRSIKRINEETVSKSLERIPFDSLPAVKPSRGFKIPGNNALIGIIREILCLGQGQSLCVSGIDAANRAYAEQAATELLKGLYLMFEGNVYGIFDSVSGECRKSLETVVNPESMIVNGAREEYGFLLEMMKRSVEYKTSAAAVVFAPECDAEAFVRAAKTTEDASLTVFVFSEADAGAQAKIVFDGGNIVVDSLVNPLSAYVCGNKHRKIFQTLARMENTNPDDTLTKFTEMMYE